jgi:hypothetical protein
MYYSVYSVQYSVSLCCADYLFKITKICFRFHYKRSKNSPPILVLAKPGTVILSSASEVQRPAYHGMVPGNQLFTALRPAYHGMVPGNQLFTTLRLVYQDYQLFTALRPDYQGMVLVDKLFTTLRPVYYGSR